MLYRNIPGLENEKKQFIQAVNSDHVAHAQMFYSKPGGANLAFAIAYATYLNCEDRQEEDACGVCPSCQKMQRLVHPDVHFVLPVYSIPSSKDYEKVRSGIVTQFREAVLSNPYMGMAGWVKKLDVGSKQCIINVNEGRGIIRNLSLKAFESRYKIVVIWLPEHMNIECANAILKVLEEPPKDTVFLMVTNDIEKNITTILSRSQIAKIRSFNDEEVVTYLNLNFPEYTSEQIERASVYAEGNLNEAQTLLDEVTDAHHEIFRDWMRACFKRDYSFIVEFADSFQKYSKQEQKGLLEYSIHILRNLLFMHNDVQSLIRISDAEVEFLKGFSKAVKEDRIAPVYELMNESVYHLERNANPKILMSDLSLKITQVFTHAY